MKKIVALLIVAMSLIVASTANSAPSAGTPAGWPSNTGTISGDASATCGGPVILTSGENEPGYGAFDFDVAPGQEFRDLGLTFDFTILSGTQAQSEPYMIVRFTDGTQAFVYSVDVNPGQGGQQTYSLDGNTYIKRGQAMRMWGDKIVSSATLAVDNGNLSIQVNGVSADGVCTTLTLPASHDSAIWLCDGNVGGDLNAYATADALEKVQQGYVEPVAIEGVVDGQNNIGGFHLACGSTLAATGEFVGVGGDVFGADYGPAREELGFYSIVG
jgi:hypothetical protein